MMLIRNKKPSAQRIIMKTNVQAKYLSFEVKVVSKMTLTNKSFDGL